MHDDVINFTSSSPNKNQIFLAFAHVRSHLNFFRCITFYRSFALMPLGYYLPFLTSILRKLSLSDAETPAKWVSNGPGNVYN